MIRLSTLLALILCFATQGCSLWDSPPPPPQAPLPPVMAFMATAKAGDTTQIDDEDFGEKVKVTQEGKFSSATGEDCRRATVIAKDRESEMVVICREGQGEFKMAPRIWGQGISK